VGIHIPPRACDACKHQAYEWYEAEDPQRYDGVFLQDRTEDKYHTKRSNREQGARCHRNTERQSLSEHRE
jgi:hypothetical protein